VLPPCDLLLVAAFHPELAPLRRLGDAMRARVANVDVAARAVGIGLPMAAAGSAMHLGECQPSVVVAIGTCGAYRGSGLSIGDVVVARRVLLVDPSALRGLSQFPEPMSTLVDAHARMADDLVRATKARPVDVATTLAITIEDASAAVIARASGADVEHLEAYAVATACAARGVPFGAVLAVANFVGGTAREEWRVHHRSAAGAAAEAVLTWIEQGGPLRLRSPPK
jgi:nucleoside phosphorylase